MRILPASAYSQRINVEAVQLGPFRLPRGTGIVFTPLVTHHLPELYPRAQKVSSPTAGSRCGRPYAYHPFGAGPRMCIGGPLGTGDHSHCLAEDSDAISIYGFPEGPTSVRMSSRRCSCQRTACR